jgi:hypothetical protein
VAGVVGIARGGIATSCAVVCYVGGSEGSVERLDVIIIGAAIEVKV